ncbi:LacI family DNA-binding transcriptional regulator [Microlunatus sp. Y2014]|uniref:LacI family DNA-binding transcriptional regulator n=1 Tax=Microlunatus sp. Y2014 TaxID=3418488 RepID=UPI003DA79031
MMAVDGVGQRGVGQRGVSQRDIAQLAGVSQSAVSVVLNGKADQLKLSVAVQQRIRAAAAELNYVPNAAARSLRGGRNGLIGVHTYESVFPVGSQDYYHDFLAGIEAQAVEDGVDLVLFTSTQQADGRRSIYAGGTNRLRLADGAIVLGMERDDAEMLQLAQERYRFVCVGRRELPGVELPFVTTDYDGGVTTLVRTAAEQGHRSVKYVMNHASYSPQRERRTAFDREAAAHGITTDRVAGTELVITSSWLREVAADHTLLVVEDGHRAHQVTVASREARMDLPQQLSVACLDVPTGEASTAGWTHLAVPRHAMGRRAVTLLLEILDGRVEPGHRDVLPCPPVPGTTLAAPA